jgi:hypothetical protein
VGKRPHLGCTYRLATTLPPLGIARSVQQADFAQIPLNLLHFN